MHKPYDSFTPKTNTQATEYYITYNLVFFIQKRKRTNDAKYKRRGNAKQYKIHWKYIFNYVEKIPMLYYISYMHRLWSYEIPKISQFDTIIKESRLK